MNFVLPKYLITNYPKKILQGLSLLEAEVELNSFTAWSMANHEYVFSAFWGNEYKISPNHKLHPIFDLASLTKPLFLNTFLMCIYSQDYFSKINIPLGEFRQHSNLMPQCLSEFILNNTKLNLNSFLNHTTGLLPWCWMGGGRTSAELTNYILSMKKNLGIEQYSDLNYFILARILENIEIDSMKSQNEFSWKKVLQKINTSLSSEFCHASIDPANSSIPYFPYDFDIQRNQFHEHFGLAHDTNANILASLESNKNIVSGHAGLFGNITDIIKSVIYFQSKLLTERKKNNNRFFHGFDTPSCEKSTAGLHHFEANKNKVFGHLGFTGTSFWMHPESSQFHILLTNRTAKRKKNKLYSCPRLYIFENRKTKQIEFYSKEGDCFSPCNKNDFIELCNHNFNKYKIFWNKSEIPSYENLTSVRQQIGQYLWNV